MYKSLTSNLINHYNPYFLVSRYRLTHAHQRSDQALVLLSVLSLLKLQG